MKIKIADLWDIEYHIKIMAGIALSEFVLLAVFNLWPKSKQEPVYQSIEPSEQPIVLDNVRITRQGNTPPLPPAPVVPVEVPDYKIIQEQLPQLDNIGNDIFSKMPKFKEGGENGEGAISKNPERPPSVTKIVEPAVPNAAKKANVKVELVVNFLVNTDGSVANVSISQIKLFNKKTGKFDMVKTIGYGIIDVTMKAAAQWRFRPAEQGGKKVKAYTKHIFTFGI
jgi:outer membrane biosynthesis protein TonB